MNIKHNGHNGHHRASPEILQARREAIIDWLYTELAPIKIGFEPSLEQAMNLRQLKAQTAAVYDKLTRKTQKQLWNAAEKALSRRKRPSKPLATIVVR